MIVCGTDAYGDPIEIPLSSIAYLRHIDGETDVRLLNGSLVRLQGTVSLPEPEKDNTHAR